MDVLSAFLYELWMWSYESVTNLHKTCVNLC